MSKKHVLIALALVAYGVGMRFLPHPDNFAPLTAMAVFAGAVLPWRYAVGTALAAVIVSDAFIGFYDGMWVVWACYVVMALMSRALLKRPTFLAGIASALIGSIFFFVVTNFAVWVMSDMYAHTLAGLQRCFALALPFFRNSILGDFAYAVNLFGAYALVMAMKHKKVEGVPTGNAVQ